MGNMGTGENRDFGEQQDWKTFLGNIGTVEHGKHRGSYHKAGNIVLENTGTGKYYADPHLITRQSPESFSARGGSGLMVYFKMSIYLNLAQDFSNQRFVWKGVTSYHILN